MRALREDPSALSQVVMAANQPVLLQRSMVEGLPDDGILPSGQVAAAISELLSCREVIEGIANEAQQCLDALLVRSQASAEPSPSNYPASVGEPQ
jgi:NAD(P)H-dependent flavin oxidoreductase YrpB (nitropropane dioxygenase family)